MIEMNPYYAHDSAVGPVFDLAPWSGRKLFVMALMALIMGAAFLSVATYVWDPKLFSEFLPDDMHELANEILGQHRQHRWPMRGGIALAAVCGSFLVLVAAAKLGDCFRTDYYLRAGAGGLSVRVPQGLSWAHLGCVSYALDLQLAWDDIQGTTITQVKQMGAMSRNSGNIGAEFKIELRSGKTFEFRLDGFGAPAYLIHERLNEAHYTVPASLEPAAEEASLAQNTGRNSSQEFSQTL